MTTTVRTDRVRAAVSIQVQHVPECAHLDRVQSMIKQALTTTGTIGTIEEVVGDFASPTVLIDRVDVTGRSVDAGASCRLGLPTVGQVIAALTKATSRVESQA